MISAAAEKAAQMIKDAAEKAAILPKDAAEKAALLPKNAAENGIIALELLKKQGLPDLILLDMIMPEMNGWQFANEFAAKYDHLCPIIVMTAAADAQQRAKDINASGWIEKPFDLNKLLLVIKQHLKATPEKLN